MGARRREFFGNTLEDALDAASQGLEVPVDQIDYDMLDEGRKGVFGLGVRQVRISVVLPESARAEADRPAPDRKPRPPREGRRRPSRSRRRRRNGAPRREERDGPQPTEVSPQHLKIESTLQQMLELMQLEVSARARPSAGSARLDLDGPDRKLLLAKDAQLLGSMQFLLNRMARRAWPETNRVQLHCDGFRNRRDEDLVDLVREVARQVESTGQPKQLDPMNPYERRLVHLTVREFDGLSSRSDGDSFLKRITVSKT